MELFFSMTGTANIAAGTFLLLFWFLYALLLPYKALNNTLSILVADKHWTTINILGVSGSLLGLFGLACIYLKEADQLGSIGLIGYSQAFLGTTLLTAALLWDTLIWPILVNHDPAILDFQGPIYTNKTFVPFFIISGIVYSIGYIIFGIALPQSGAYPFWGSMALLGGAPLFGMGSILGKLQVYPRSIGITLLCGGLIWLGIFII